MKKGIITILMVLVNKLIVNKQKIIYFIFLFNPFIVLCSNINNDTIYDIPDITVNLDTAFNLQINFENRTECLFIQDSRFGFCPYVGLEKLVFFFYICNKNDSIIRRLQPHSHFVTWGPEKDYRLLIYPDSVESFCIKLDVFDKIKEIDFEKEKLLIIIYNDIKVVEIVLRPQEERKPGMTPAMYRLDFKKLIYVENFSNTVVPCY